MHLFPSASSHPAGMAERSNMCITLWLCIYNILYYTIRYDTILYYTLHYSTRHDTILYYTIRYYTILYYATLHNTTRHYTTVYYTILVYAKYHCISLYIIELYAVLAPTIPPTASRWVANSSLRRSLLLSLCHSAILGPATISLAGGCNCCNLWPM